MVRQAQTEVELLG